MHVESTATVRFVVVVVVVCVCFGGGGLDATTGDGLGGGGWEDGAESGLGMLMLTGCCSSTLYRGLDADRWICE
jgi:hypothetical protein